MTPRLLVHLNVESGLVGQDSILQADSLIGLREIRRHFERPIENRPAGWNPAPLGLHMPLHL